METVRIQYSSVLLNTYFQGLFLLRQTELLLRLDYLNLILLTALYPRLRVRIMRLKFLTIIITTNLIFPIDPRLPEAPVHVIDRRAFFDIPRDPG